MPFSGNGGLTFGSPPTVLYWKAAPPEQRALSTTSRRPAYRPLGVSMFLCHVTSSVISLNKPRISLSSYLSSIGPCLGSTPRNGKAVVPGLWRHLKKANARRGLDTSAASVFGWNSRPIRPPWWPPFGDVKISAVTPCDHLRGVAWLFIIRAQLFLFFFFSLDKAEGAFYCSVMFTLIPYLYLIDALNLSCSLYFRHPFSRSLSFFFFCLAN